MFTGNTLPVVIVIDVTINHIIKVIKIKKPKPRAHFESYRVNNYIMYVS